MDVQKAWQIISDKLSAWMHHFVSILPNILLAAVVLTVGIFIARRLKGWSARLLKNILPHQSVLNLTASFIATFFGAVVIFITLSILKLDKALVTLLAGAGVAGLAFAFAFQDIAANFISGIFLSFRRPIRIGDIVKVKDHTGIVTQINLRDTELRTFQGIMVIIPNKEIFQSPIENYSVYKKRRFDISVGISYAEDLQAVKKLTLETLEGMAGLVADEKTSFVYTGFGDSTINFTVRIWTDQLQQAAYLSVGSEAIMLIKKAFDNAGIDMPFPIRTLDFNMKGGATLADMLAANENNEH